VSPSGDSTLVITLMILEGGGVDTLVSIPVKGCMTELDLRTLVVVAVVVVGGGGHCWSASARCSAWQTFVQKLCHITMKMRRCTFVLKDGVTMVRNFSFYTNF
jgi:hypothetical protein